jgi:hypothetical protein
VRALPLICVLMLVVSVSAADLESRALTHYVPQDLLETVVRTEGWTEIVLKPYGGVRKGDVARIWAGGLIDRGGDQPGKVVAPPSGPDKKTPVDPARLALSQEAAHAYAIIFKTDDGVVHRCVPTGKPLEIPLVKEGARLWIGFNDERGRYRDNHLGQGLRHERDPAWIRVEVIRTIVD